MVCVVVGDPIVRRGLDVEFHNRDYPAHLMAQQSAARSRPALVPGSVDSRGRGRGPGRQRPAPGPEPAVPGGSLAAGGDGGGLCRPGLRHRSAPRSHRAGTNRPSGRRSRYRRPGARRRWPCWRTSPRYRPLGGRRGGAGARAVCPGCLPAAARRAVHRAGCRQGGKAVNVLFIHDAFPAQFGRLALELTRRHGWRCSFLVQSLSSCPTPSPEMLETLELHQVPLAAEHRSSEGIPWPQIYGHYLEQCQTVHDALRGQAEPAPRPDRRSRRPGRPDLVAARGRRLPDHHLLRILLREQPSRHLVPDRPAAGRARPVLSALHQRADPGDPGRLRRRLLGDPLAEAVVPASGFTPRSRSISTGSTPSSTTPAQRRGGLAKRSIPPGTRVVTFVVPRPGVDPGLRPVHEGRPPDRPDALRRASSWWSAARRSTTAGTSSTPARPASSSGC